MLLAALLLTLVDVGRKGGEEKSGLYSFLWRVSTFDGASSGSLIRHSGPG